MIHLAIRPLCAEVEHRAVELSQQFSLPIYDQLQADDRDKVAVLVELDEQQIYMRLADWSPRARLSIDLMGGKLGYRQAHINTHSELLKRATGILQGQRPSLVDATAGMGTDSLMLAAAGFQVTALERQPILALMLAQALARAQMTTDALSYFRNVRFVGADAIQWLQKAGKGSVDLVYLDPMFPERAKSAQVKKPMQLLQALLGDEADDGSTLLEPAIAAARYRVVVKRPLRAPYLADQQPSHQVKGTNIRFDVYGLRSMRELVETT